MRVTGRMQCRVNSAWCDRTAHLCGVSCVCGEQHCCDIPLPGEADREETQLEACLARQSDNRGKREMVAGGALGHRVSHLQKGATSPCLSDIPGVRSYLCPSKNGFYLGRYSRL